jgi:hypothetical protein
MGRRLPIPKALDVILKPGAAWRRLYSFLRTVEITHCTVFLSKPFLTISF